MGQGSHRPGKVLEFDLGPGKLLEFQNSAICPGIVLEFCKFALENVKLSLKIVNAPILFHSFGFMRCAKENCVKIAGFVEERGGHGARIQFTCSPGIYQYHSENILVIEMKSDMFSNSHLQQKQSKID